MEINPKACLGTIPAPRSARISQLRAMPRRKQARPRKIGEQPPDSAGSPQDIPGDRDGESSSKRNKETKMCEECCANFFVPSEFREHQKNCTENPPVLTMNSSEGTVPTESFPEAPLGTFPRDRMDGRTHKDIQAEGCTSSVENREGKMDGGAVGGMYPKIEPPPRPAAPSLSCLPQPEAPNTFDAVSFSAATLSTISMVLEWFMCMFQQYFQLLMELIRIQTALVAPPALPPSTDPLTALGAAVSPQLLAAVPLIRQNAGSQSLPLEPLEQGKLPHSNPGIAASSLLDAGLSSSFPLMPEESQDLPGSVSQFLNPLLPQSSSSVIFQNPLSAVSSMMDSSRKGQGKPPNISVSESPDAEEPSFKHQCQFCGKGFGNSRALQIHLRSHIPGERPYKCIICGNHFTTKENFKVHVESHKDEYSHMKMNPHPVPEALDNVPTSTGIPCGMSVPLDESNLIVGSKPLLTALPASGVPQSISSLAGIKESLPGTFSSELQSRPSPKSEGGSSSSGAVGHESGTEQSLSSPQAACNVSIFLISGQNEQGSETSKSQQLVENIDKSTADPNECLICHRVLSCPSSLRMHYRTHTGERPFKCRICSRAFSTKGSLKAHQGVHRANAPSKVQHLCPICQKKFANAVVLQQHIRMHMGGQIPNTPVPEPPCDSPEVDPEKNRDRGDGDPEKTCPEEMVESIDMENDVDSQRGPRGSSKARVVYNAQSESPSAFPGVTALQNHMRIVTSSLNLQQQSSLNSSENGSAESDGMANDPSLVVGDADCQHSQSPFEGAALQALSPANSQPESLSSKSAFNSQEDSGTRGKSERPKNAPAEVEGVVGALDLMYGRYIGNAIKEEPGLHSANGECGGSSIPAAFVRAPPALVKMELPGAGPLSTGHFTDPPAPSPGVTPVLGPRPRSCRPSKVHTCPTCGKSFPCASALQIHQRSHTGEKPFACTICGKAFTTKGNLKIHGRTHLWRSSGTQGRWVSLDNPLGAQEGVGDVPQGCVGEHQPRRVRGRAQLQAGPADQGGLGGPEQGPAHGWGSPLNHPPNLQGGHNPGWQHP